MTNYELQISGGEIKIEGDGLNVRRAIPPEQARGLMIYLSKSGPTKGKNADWSYYAPSDCSLTAENLQARPTMEGGLPQPERHVHIVSHELAQRFSQQSPEAQALAEIALEFCRECRGWKNARSINDFGYSYISESVSKELASTKIPPHERQFHYTHLDKVMAAVRDWLKPDGIIPPHHAGIFVDAIPKLFDKYFFGTLDDTGLCRELMAACVKANRSGK